MSEWRSVLAISSVLLLAPGGTLQAQPRKEAKEARDARKEAREERREAREARRQGDPNAIEEIREAREATREAREETREAVEARRKRARELRERLRKGPLADKEKEELVAIRARLREIHKERIERWKERREQVRERRRKARREIIDTWVDLHKRPKVREELTLHARRTARLERARHLAEVNDREDAQERIDKLIKLENERHRQRMDTLKGEK
jgi:hypothetical protein